MNSLSKPILEVKHVSAVFPSGDTVLRALTDITFSVPQEQFVCVLGPSACGKSTLLRIISGLLQPTDGKVVFKGRVVSEPQTEIGLVFQQANLMPWRTVLENITLPLELRGTPLEQARKEASVLIDLVGLKDFITWLPRDLSGGMAQRVAIARSLIHDPDLLLLDEPFGALDALTREQMGTELLRIWAAKRKTVIMVTHSISEALFLADRVLVFSSQPGEVKLDMKVPLPRPRSEAVRYDKQFTEMAKELRAAIG